MIFRDHALSDLIGFHYQRYVAEQAAEDLIGKLEAIARAAVAESGGRRPALASIILDGENCWEYYPNGGLDFLRDLYHRIARHPKIKAVRVRDYLAKHPATDKLAHLFSGSWISHNFAIWIGPRACNRAWDLLTETRAVLVERAATGAVEAKELARAWDEIYIAEGSDWFWWFDDHHSSSQDWLFDQLFRQHLQNVYLLIGLEPPPELFHPIGPVQAASRPYTEPTGLVNVKVNGHETYFEWIGAGVYATSTAPGTMTLAEAQRIERLHFGFESDRLLLRFDALGRVRQRLADIDTLRIAFSSPAGFELLLSRPGTARPAVQLFQNDVPASAAEVEAAADAILEIAIPWRSLAVDSGAAVRFYAELIRDGQSIERVPHAGTIDACVPSPDYELMMWQA